MANISQHKSKSVTKLLLVGDSGSGKTSALASLANAGKKLRILDYDDGLDILSEYLTPEAVPRVSYITLRDSLGQANAFRRGAQLLSAWRDGEENFGSVKEWGDDTVLVIDSLTLMGEAALKSALVFNNKKPTEQPTQPEWGTAARDVQNILQYITGDEVKCNVVVTSHIQYMEGELGIAKAYPTSVGSKLSTKIGRYFNCVCRIDSKTTSKGNERSLRTVSDNKMDLKVTAPSLVETNMELDLNKLFTSIQSNAKSKLETSKPKGDK